MKPLSRIMKDLGFYSTHKITCVPVTVSWILEEDTKLLSQKQKTLLFLTKVVARASCWFASIRLVSQVPFSQLRTQERCLHRQWAILQERTTELGEFTTFIVSRSKPVLAHGEDVTSSFKADHSNYNPGNGPGKECQGLDMTSWNLQLFSQSRQDWVVNKLLQG